MDTKRKTWSEHFNELVKFKKLYGHCDASTISKDKTFLSLARWISSQRGYYKFKNKRLTSEQITKLNSIGFKWAVVDNLRKKASDKELLNELKRIGLILDRPPNCKEIRKFSKYDYFTYRKRFGSLPSALNKAGLDSLNEMKWNKKFTELIEFRNKYGHCRVIASKKNNEQWKLACWINRQKQYYRYKNKFLTPERIARLNSLEFEWLKPGDKEKQLRINSIKEELLDNLRRISLLLGRPPKVEELSKYGKQTSVVYQQRFGSVKVALSKAGLDNFNNAKWNVQFTELKKFMEKYGHCKVPFSRNHTGGRPLKYWVYAQRQQYNSQDKILTPERITKLNSIGFEWKIRNKHSKYPETNATNEELLNNLKKIAEFLKRPPKAIELDKYGTYTYKIYMGRFGSMPNALTIAGLNTYKDARWNEKFKELKKFKIKYGHCNVTLSKKYSGYLNLRYWVNTQRRRYYYDKTILPQRTTKLNSIGFNWGTKHKSQKQH